MPALTQTDSQSTPSIHKADAPLTQGLEVLALERDAIEDLRERLRSEEGEAFLLAIQSLLDCKGRVVVTGMGKSGHIGRKIAATLSSTGTPSYFLHPAEGSHGDSGVLMRQDVVLAISNSGETPELLALLPVIKRIGLPVVAMTGKPQSTLAQQSDVHLNIAVKQEACPLGLAPTTSTTVTLALGDALAVTLLTQKGFTQEDFALFHPAGALGKRLLLHVRDLMRTGEAIPMVQEDTPFLDALLVMSDKKLGMTLVMDASGKVSGLLTDGDVRRALVKQENQESKQNDIRKIEILSVMTRTPKGISGQELAVAALRKMEDSKITTMLVLDENGQPEGVLSMHDLLAAGLG